MDMSWQTTFALACAAVLAAIVPGTLGYTSARLETAAQQRQELVRLRAELQAARQVVQQVSTPCMPPVAGTSDDPAHLPPQAKSERHVDPPPTGVTSPEQETDPAIAPHDQE